jgi:4-hydroxybenzoate polyprenyltransferase
LDNPGQVVSADRMRHSRAVLKALRPHQWVKNLLVFVPLLASHQYGSQQSVMHPVLAAIAFGLTASGVYLLNDLLDVDHDRRHDRKRERPFAAGHLSLLHGWLLFPLPVMLGFAISSLTLPLSFLWALTGYFVLALVYSMRLKQIVIVDVLTLAVLYELRIFAGAAAIGVYVSFWLLIFSMFFFLSLAFIKRFGELKSARLKGSEGKILGRGYTEQDLEIVSVLGTTSGCLAVLVLAFYVQDSHARELYGTPELIWLACLLLFYWITRAWILVHRSRMHDDPIVFALTDKVSWAVGAGLLIVFLAATLLA